MKLEIHPKESHENISLENLQINMKVGGITSTFQVCIVYFLEKGAQKIIPSQMEVAPLHCTADITQKRGLFKNTKEIEKM